MLLAHLTVALRLHGSSAGRTSPVTPNRGEPAPLPLPASQVAGLSTDRATARWRHSSGTTSNGPTAGTSTRRSPPSKRSPAPDPRPTLVYARLAELSWVEGHRLDRWRRAGAIDRYLDAVAYAYDFLFGEDLAAGRQPSDPRFRTACELYNGGLERLIRRRRASRTGKIMPEGTIKS